MTTMRPSTPSPATSPDTSPVAPGAASPSEPSELSELSEPQDLLSAADTVRIETALAANYADSTRAAYACA